MTQTLKLMPDYEAKQNMNRPDIDQRRWNSPLGYTRSVAADTAARVCESRKLFKFKFFRGCCHSHTQHSDGIGTVEETAAMVAAAELDFQFVTDHWGVTQAPECVLHKLWVGQEPGTQHHHLGILGLDHAFVPTMNLVADVAEVRRRGGTPFIPHPTGWWPRRVYTEEQKLALRDLPTPFLMEIINGANNIVTAFDYTDQSAVELWDELLTTGRRIHAMGNTDTHSPHGIGMVWNGVLAPRCDQPSILRALSAGKSFASEAPLLHLAVGRTVMGGQVRDRADAGPAKFTVADSRGLLRVRLVADGKVRKTWHLDGDTTLTADWNVPKSIKRCVRIEAISIDGRRGYSNPVYLV
jgi:hypothetical protein